MLSMAAAGRLDQAQVGLALSVQAVSLRVLPELYPELRMQVIVAAAVDSIP